MTNRENALALLQRHANHWVTGQMLVEAGAGYRYSARIWELRQPKWGGYNIEERRDPSGRSALGQFRLVDERQMSLFGEAA